MTGRDVTLDDDGDDDNDDVISCRVRMTVDRIQETGIGEHRDPGTGRTRWPGHCADTEATPQPRPPGTPSCSLSRSVSFLPPIVSL